MQRDSPANARIRTTRRTSCWRGVLPTCTVASEVPIRPSAVFAPVAVTRAVPWPLTINVPE